MKKEMKGHRFNNAEDVKKKNKDGACKQTDEFEKCFQQWQQRLDKCIELQGEFVEYVKVVM